MIRLYRQTPEGIERTTQVDAAEQHLDSVFWIDLLTPEPAEIKFVERLCGLEMPTYDEMREIEATSRLYTEDGGALHDHHGSQPGGYGIPLPVGNHPRPHGG